MLDLPSSDLDVVVCGLDRVEVPVTVSPTPQKNLVSFGESPNEPRTSETSVTHHISVPQYVPKHVNAERVVRLAAELEKQPWAVHVKAIPTATVPVVKVLADPSRLPGVTAPHGSEWMQPDIQDQSAGQTAPPSEGEAQSTTSAPSTAGDEPSAVQGHQPPVSQFQPPAWRGADVINGLLSLDITFEGPEHGGIGSTEFSARVVQDACNETGLLAEQTPIVQAIMVLKELLAQRRLNEPFSGGLSSYALLLLVLAVMCERKVIREELDRVERQRRLVAAGGGSSGYAKNPPPKEKTTELHAPPAQTPGVVAVETQSPAQSTTVTKKKQSGQGSKSKGGDNTVTPVENRKEPAKEARPAASPSIVAASNGSEGAAKTLSPSAPSNGPGSSWANIAKGRTQQQTATEKGSDAQQTSQKQKTTTPPASTKPSSFADAVARMAAAQKPQPVKKQNAAQSQQNAGTGSGVKKQNKQQEAAPKMTSNAESSLPKLAAVTPDRGENVNNESVVEEDNSRKIEADEQTSKQNNYSSGPVDSSIVPRESLFPQGFNDAIEVLCSGETTSGKVLMHFLLFYGQHFDAQATAIDISGKHHRELGPGPYSHLSPYIQRRTAGNIDPVTGMLTVDPIVVYDPLEGAENNNVARRCFLWSNVRWVFAQSYMTLSSAVELNPTPPTTPGAGTRSRGASNSSFRSSGQQGQIVQQPQTAAWNGPYNPDDKASPFDPTAPLLELLLSY